MANEDACTQNSSEGRNDSKIFYFPFHKIQIVLFFTAMRITGTETHRKIFDFFIAY